MVYGCAIDKEKEQIIKLVIPVHILRVFCARSSPCGASSSCGLHFKKCDVRRV
jgi:hypothetical protein